MNEDIDMFLNTGTSNYLESLAKIRALINPESLDKLDQVIDVELDLALLGAEKAKSELLQMNKSNIIPLKGV